MFIDLSTNTDAKFEHDSIEYLKAYFEKMDFNNDPNHTHMNAWALVPTNHKIT